MVDLFNCTPPIEASSEALVDPAVSLAECAASNLPLYEHLMGVYTKLDEVVSNNFRTYEEMMSGKPAYAETLFYRVEKRSLLTGAVIQSTYIPIMPNTDIFEFIDTQVSIGRYYEYEVIQ